MKFQSPPVGWPIQFFPTGDRNHPHAATVTECGMGGQVKVNYWRSGGGDALSGGKFIRHIDDPWVKEHADMIQKTGCWDYIPGLIYQAPPESSEKKRSKEPAKV